MKVLLTGRCLNGDHSKIIVSSSRSCALYVHEDSQEPVHIALSIENIVTENHLVHIGKRKRICVVEHLFSALYGLNLFRVKIDVFGSGMPFFDGSAKEIVETLCYLPVQNVMPLSVHQNVEVGGQDSFIRFSPSNSNLLSVEMELSHDFIGTQRLVVDITRDTYIREVATARTFVFTTEDDPRIKDLPPYGIGITQGNTYCAEPLRFKDEFVRHKVLDLLGDLYVLGKPVHGFIHARNTSHMLNLTFVRRLSGSVEGR